MNPSEIEEREALLAQKYQTLSYEAREYDGPVNLLINGHPIYAYSITIHQSVGGFNKIDLTLEGVRVEVRGPPP